MGNLNLKNDPPRQYHSLFLVLRFNIEIMVTQFGWRRGLKVQERLQTFRRNRNTYNNYVPVFSLLTVILINIKELHNQITKH